MRHDNMRIHNRFTALAMTVVLTSTTITACGGQDTTNDTAVTESSKAPTETASTEAATEPSTDATTESEDTMPTEAEIASANTKTIEITCTTETDNRHIEDYNVDVLGSYPVVSCDEPNYAMLRDGLDELSATIAQTAKAEIDTLEESARTAAQDGHMDAGSAYAYEESMEIIRADSSVLSLLCTIYSNQGGAHPSTSYATYNYDPQAGMAFELDEIIQDEQYDQLAGRIAEALIAKYDPSMFNDYMTLQMSSADGAVDDDALLAALTETIQNMIDDGTLSYTIGLTGITFYFEAYSVAVYAAGPLNVTFQYADAPELVWEGYTHAPAN